MQSMEVKKNGKVEHSQNSHDDQVFSYLMALYVWYDGKNLAEKFHIIKNTIKTDEDIEIEDGYIDDNLESVAPVDIERATYDEDSEVAQQLRYLEENSKLITTADLKTTNYFNMIERRDIILANNKSARESYAKERGLDPSMFTDAQGNNFVTLPENLFLDDDFMFEDDIHRPSVLVGNLADLWDKV